jgi:hypothetical protein
VLTFPQLGLAFGEYVRLTQNQEMAVALDPATGEGTIDLVLWLRDSDGEVIELPVELTTGVPAATDCSQSPYCLGEPGDPGSCVGTPWSATSGTANFVGWAVVPDGQTIVECYALILDLMVAIDPLDTDGDGRPDALDGCPGDADPTQADSDGDGVGNACDNCPAASNSRQRDRDGNGTGDRCEPLRVDFKPSASVVAAGWLPDSGSAFGDPAGYGWNGAPFVQFFERTSSPIRSSTLWRSPTTASGKRGSPPAISTSSAPSATRRCRRGRSAWRSRTCRWRTGSTRPRGSSRSSARRSASGTDG